MHKNITITINDDESLNCDAATLDALRRDWLTALHCFDDAYDLPFTKYADFDCAYYAFGQPVIDVINEYGLPY